MGASQTLGLEEAAAALRVSPSTLRKRAAAGKVPGYKPGRQWVFLPDEIAAYLKGSRPCRYIDAATLRTGGADSKSSTAKRGSPLEHEIEIKLKNSKPRLAILRGGKSG